MNTAEHDLIAADRVLGPSETHEPGWLRIDGDRIAEVGAGAPPRAPDHDLGAVTLAPGFVDAHNHGGGGAAYGDGPEAARTAAAAHLRHGTTTLVASLVTESHETLLASCRDLAGLVEDGTLAGLHLEGPWLSPAHPGAHDPALLTAPEPAAVEALLDAARGTLRMVTLAPELPGALDAIGLLADAGVTAAIGHTDADYETAREALAAGARAGTHLFNAMPPLHHRAPGPVAALLGSPAYVELIADGVHLHPAVLRLAAEAAPGRFVLVTDAMSASCRGDGDYALGPLSVEVRDGVARVAGTETIAGSTLTMAAAVRYAVRTTGLPLAEVLRSATSTPAAMLGLDDVGVLAPGRRADLVALDGDLEVVRVMRRGRWLDL